MNNTVIVLYARLPSPDMVGKTRVGNAIENQNLANGLALALILDAYDRYKPVDSEYDFVWYYRGDLFDIDTQAFPAITKWIKQPEGDIGVGMKTIHKQLSETYEKVIIVGSDIPLISRAVIGDVIAALDTHDVAIAPVADGGYGLLGARQYTDLYSDISNWESGTSGYHLVEDTTALCTAQNITLWQYEPTLFDIDYPADLVLLYKKLTDSPELEAAMPRTAAWLREYQHLL